MLTTEEEISERERMAAIMRFAKVVWLLLAVAGIIGLCIIIDFIF